MFRKLVVPAALLVLGLGALPAAAETWLRPYAPDFVMRSAPCPVPAVAPTVTYAPVTYAPAPTVYLPAAPTPGVTYNLYTPIPAATPTTVYTSPVYSSPVYTSPIVIDGPRKRDWRHERRERRERRDDWRDAWRRW